MVGYGGAPLLEIRAFGAVAVAVPALHFQDQHVSGREPDQEVGAVLADHAAVHVEHLEAEMIVLHPGGDRRVVVEGIGFRCLPGAVVYAQVDVAALRVFARLAGVPGEHVAGRADRVIAVEDRRQPFRVPEADRLQEMLHDLGHVEHQHEPPLHRVAGERRRFDHHPVRMEQLFGKAHQLRDERGPVAAPIRPHLVVDLLRGLEHDALQTALPRQPLQVDRRDPGQVGLALHDRRQLRDPGGLRRGKNQRFHVVPVHGQPRSEHAVDAHHVRPRKREPLLLPDRLDGGLRQRRRRHPGPRLVRQERERHAEDVHVLRFQQAGVGADVVGGAAKPAADHLFAQQLAGEGAQAHDVGHGLGVPPLGQHADRDHVLNPFAGTARAAHRIDLPAQQLGPLPGVQPAPLAR